MSETRLQRIAALGGIAAILIGAVCVFVPAAPPAVDADPQQIATYFADHRGGLLVSLYVTGLTDVLLAGFFFPLASWLARRGASRTTAGAVVVAGAMAITLDLVGTGLLATLAYLGDKQLDPALIRLLFATASVFRFSTNNFAIALIGLALGLAVLETGVLARWLGWAALLLAAASAVVPALPLGSPAALGVGAVFTLWLIVAAVAMYRDARPEPAASGARPATA